MYSEFMKNFRDLLHNSIYLYLDHLSSNQAFVLSYKLELHTVMLLIIKKLSRSLQVELAYFFYIQSDLAEVASKSAFCQARMKIKSSLFKAFNEDLLCLLHRHRLYGHPSAGQFKKVAIDGFKLRLPQTKALKEEFGTVKNQHKREIAMASAALAYDINTGYAIEADIDKIKTSEKGLVLPWLEKDVFDEEHLLIYDRFYLGWAYAYEHIVRGINFIMRARVNWNKATKEFIASNSKDKIVTITIPEKALTALRKKGYDLTGKATIKVRLVKGEDLNGKEVYYVTNVLDKQVLSRTQINQDYAKRWQVETAIDALKNKIQLECFSGHSKKVIEQDFYATIILYNISKVVHNHAMEELIKKEQAKQDSKAARNQKETKVMTKDNMEYQPNHNLIIGVLGFNLFDLVGKNGEQVYEDMIQFIVRFPEKVRKGRKYKISYKTNRLKGRHFYHTNYKRAI